MMKKADVLQLTIVLMGIIFGFVAVQYLISSLFEIFAWIFSGGYDSANYLTPGLSIFAVVALQAICCWLLITKSGKLAAYFYQKSALGNGFKIVTKPNDLLHVLLIVIGIYLLLSHITPLLTSIFESFIKRIPRGVLGAFEDERPVPWARLLLDIILPLILLMFARSIADYFAKNMGTEHSHIEESFDGTDMLENNDA